MAMDASIHQGLTKRKANLSDGIFILKKAWSRGSDGLCKEAAFFFELETCLQEFFTNEFFVNTVK